MKQTNKMDEALTSLIKQKRVKLHKIRNEKGDKATDNRRDRNYHENIMSNSMATKFYY